METEAKAPEKIRARKLSAAERLILDGIIQRAQECRAELRAEMCGATVTHTKVEPNDDVRFLLALILGDKKA